MFNPWMLAIAAAVAASGFAAGWQVQGWRCDAARTAAVEHAIQQADKLAAQDREVLEAAAERAARVETQTRTIEREVIRYVTSTPIAARDCLDADGLRIWAAANSGEWTVAAPAPGAAASGPAAAQIDQSRRPAGQPRGDGGAVSPVPRATQHPFGVGD